MDRTKKSIQNINLFSSSNWLGNQTDTLEIAVQIRVRTQKNLNDN